MVWMRQGLRWARVGSNCMPLRWVVEVVVVGVEGRGRSAGAGVEEGAGGGRVEVAGVAKERRILLLLGLVGHLR